MIILTMNEHHHHHHHYSTGNAEELNPCTSNVKMQAYMCLSVFSVFKKILAGIIKTKQGNALESKMTDNVV
jgi:hypothetical protein